MRLHLLVPALLLAATIPAHADQIYKVTFADNSGFSAAGGTGSFAINVSPSTASNAVTTYYASGSATNILSAFSISLNGTTFTLNPSEYLQFTSGNLTDLTYNAATNGATLQINGLSYQETTQNGQFAFYGTISASPAASTAVTPEPASLVLLGTGVLGLAGALRRRMRRA